MKVADTILRGATRPALLLGIPLYPLFIVAGVTLIGSLWLLVLINFFASIVVAVPGLTALIWMRGQTRKDDHRLHQWMLRTSIGWRSLGRGNCHHWHCDALAAYQFRGPRR